MLQAHVLLDGRFAPFAAAHRKLLVCFRQIPVEPPALFKQRVQPLDGFFGAHFELPCHFPDKLILPAKVMPRGISCQCFDAPDASRNR